MIQGRYAKRYFASLDIRDLIIIVPAGRRVYGLLPQISCITLRGLEILIDRYREILGGLNRDSIHEIIVGIIK